MDIVFLKVITDYVRHNLLRAYVIVCVLIADIAECDIFTLNISNILPCVHFTVFTLSIQTTQILTMLVLKFEQVQFTTRCCIQNLLDVRQTV